tara:strand:- start:443 stop:649 length:207 start_codon:yes stop_codon:yes gene_type:complete
MASSSKDALDVVDENENEEKTYTMTRRELELMLSVLTVVSSRGGFKPHEFKQVGELFDKLSLLTNKGK